MAMINIKVKTAADTTLTGAFICFELPADDYSGAGIQLIDSTAGHNRSGSSFSE